MIPPFLTTRGNYFCIMMFNWISLLCLEVEVPFESGEEYGNFSSGYGKSRSEGIVLFKDVVL